ncbi:MAG TPA: hypothetical protein VK427_09550, partial [Kofleriaceae bacterium]|nr:hypothetical protein [Kofleriaceae bacterium]
GPGGTWTVAEQVGTDDGIPELLWAGDLDRDGAMDLLLDVTPKYSFQLYRLYLSSAATEGPFAAVAESMYVTD